MLTSSSLNGYYYADEIANDCSFSVYEINNLKENVTIQIDQNNNEELMLAFNIHKKYDSVNPSAYKMGSDLNQDNFDSIFLYNMSNPQIINIEKNTEAKTINILFTKTFLLSNNLDKKSVDNLFKLFFSFDKNKLMACLDYETRQECISVLNAIKNDDLNRIFIKGKIYQLLYQYLKFFEVKKSNIPNSIEDKDLNICNGIAEYVKTALDGNVPLSIQYIARQMHMSESSVKKKFYKFYHKGIYKHYQELRFAKALELIKNSTFLIKDIAYQLCYTDVSKFCQAIKKHTGKLPTELRKTK